jgi:CRISPR-associated protein Cmr6
MSVPAVPKYVIDAAGNWNTTDCPPGHRFNLYFPIWKSDWQLDKSGKANALGQSLKLGHAKWVLDALCRRQNAIADTFPSEYRCVMNAISTAPFATGLGLEHPVENGFAFLSPYGLPYLAGSGVKGILRRAAEELFGEVNEIIKALFGHEDAKDARRGALTCWDVFPVPPENGSHKDSLVVEIMTPHFSDYYQGNSSPHDAGKPNPIPFLAVPAGSKFRFVIICEPTLLTNAVTDWKEPLGKIIEHAFDWLGFGAKTAVGYGAMALDTEADERKHIEEEQRHKQQQEQEKVDRITENLPKDAAWIEKQRHSGAWNDVNAFLDSVETFLQARESLSTEAYQRLSEDINQRWRGIMDNPDAVQGKKQKPKFKPRPRQLVKRLSLMVQNNQ